ncbi:MAG: response regulator transcription factor [Christensenellales bacterium]|jgi:two-component system response regulator YesN
MFKIMLVDDSPIELSGLKDLVQWDALDLQVVATATNGRQALTLIERQMPDILITDIRMPIMDGIELLTRIKERKYPIKPIFLSAYEDFDYARKGIELNVSGYIMKPVRMPVLMQQLERVVAQCRQERSAQLLQQQLAQQLEQSLPLLREQLYQRLIQGYYDEEEEILARLKTLKVPLQEQVDYCALMVVDEGSIVQREAGATYLSGLMVVNIMTQALPECLGAPFQLQENRYVAILQVPRQGREAYMVALEQRLLGLMAQLRENTGMLLSLFVGDTVPQLDQVHASYAHATEMTSGLLPEKEEAIWFYTDLERDQTPEVVVDNEFIRKTEGRITQYIVAGNTDDIAPTIHELFDYLEQSGLGTSYIQNLCIFLISAGMKVLFEMNASFRDIFAGEDLIRKLLEFRTIANIRQWMINILTIFATKAREKKRSKNQLVIDRVLTVVANRYNQDLTLSDVAEQVHLTPNYVGALFKSVVGESFVDYLTRYRMERAKELLGDIDKKIYEVSSAVGYNNISYFCTKFKNIYGLSPTEYREKVIRMHD